MHIVQSVPDALNFTLLSEQSLHISLWNFNEASRQVGQEGGPIDEHLSEEEGLIRAVTIPALTSSEVLELLPQVFPDFLGELTYLDHSLVDVLQVYAVVLFEQDQANPSLSIGEEPVATICLLVHQTHGFFVVLKVDFSHRERVFFLQIGSHFSLMFEVK